MDQRSDFGGLGCWVVLVLLIVGLAAAYMRSHDFMSVDTGGSAQDLVRRNSEQHGAAASAFPGAQP